MKKFFIVFIILCVGFFANAQSSMIEFYKDSLRKTNVDSNKAYCLYILSYYYQNSNPDSALILGQAAYDLSVKSKFRRGKIGALGQIALAYDGLGNFSNALKKYFEQLQIIEVTNDPYDIASAYLRIALVYNNQKDLKNALYYAYKADSIATIAAVVEKHPSLRLYSTLDLGDIYSNNDQLDSATYYTNICYHESIRLDTLVQRIEQKRGTYPLIGTALNNLGNIYFKKNDYNEALMYFQNCIPYLDSMQDYRTLAECYYGMAKAFDKKNLQDSALRYAERSFNLSSDNQFLKNSVDASYLLARLYKQKNNLDSAFAFQQTYIVLKDSFNNAEKIKQLQNITITEEQRQLQLANDLKQQAKDRRLKLELLLVGMFIPVLFFITAFISGRRVHKRIIKFSGIFSVLFLFEYMTLLLHPWVMEKTGHSPFYEIIIFVALASIISPTHHRIENWLITRLNLRHQEKMNKAIAAKAAAEANAQEKEKAAAEAKLIATAVSTTPEQKKPDTR